MNSDLVRYERLTKDNAYPCVQVLEHPHRWCVVSKSGCGCTFRHVTSAALGFGTPEDWCPEESDAIAATKALYGHLQDLLSSGHEVDLVDAWYDTPPEEIQNIDVSLDEVSEKEFRMFENHKFRLKKENTQP